MVCDELWCTFKPLLAIVDDGLKSNIIKRTVKISNRSFVSLPQKQFGNYSPPRLSFRIKNKKCTGIVKDTSEEQKYGPFLDISRYIQNGQFWIISTNSQRYLFDIF